MADKAVVPGASAQLGEKRHREFSEEEMEVLVFAVGRNYPLLYGDNVNSTSKANRNAVWKRVVTEVSRVRGATRTKECLLLKYHELRSDVKTKMAHSVVSGEQLKLSDIEREVAKYVSLEAEHEFCLYTRRTSSGAVIAELIKEDEANIDNVGRKKGDRMSFQIFPDPCDSLEDQSMMRARLPSIVVEPTDLAEVESGELRWPPNEFLVQDGETSESEDQENPMFKQCKIKEEPDITTDSGTDPKEATSATSTTTTDQI